MKNALRIIVLSIFAVLVLSACDALSAPEEASGPIEAIPLEVEEPTVEPVEEAVAEEEMDMDEEEHADEGMEEEHADEEMSEEEHSDEMMEETATGEPMEEGASAAAGGAVIYSIVPGESTVRFELDEDLSGNRITVVGETDQVAGEVALDFNNLADAQVGVIQINARTLETDNNFRNRAIQNRILNTGEHEFITFAPTAVSGLPESVAVGETIEFVIEGDLTVAGVTQPATFDVSATAVSEAQITGSASTIITQEAFNIAIPEVPRVANVEEEIELYIDFIANAQ